MPSAAFIGAWCALAAHMRIGRFADLEGLLQAGIGKKNGGIVKSTRNEFIGRLLGLMFDLTVTTSLSYTVCSRMDSEARAGNQAARYGLTAWYCITYGAFMFAKERRTSPTGFTFIFILLVDWIIRSVSPRQANVAREQEEAEALLKVESDDGEGHDSTSFPA